MDNYYSQAGQDQWVTEFYKNKKNGYFLDIGAHNGISINNTYHLEKNLDWNGICIEADPDIFELLKNNRKCKCVNIAASSKKGSVNFSQRDFSGHISDEGVSIKSDTMENILDSLNAPNHIDYMSLDVEGHEIDVLLGFPFDRYSIGIMTVEHNLYLGSSANKDGIRDILESNGYSIIRENVAHEGSEFEDWYINNKIIDSINFQK